MNPKVKFEWDDVRKRGYTVVSRYVLNLGRYVESVRPLNSSIDSAIRKARSTWDASLYVTSNPSLFPRKLVNCLVEKYFVGELAVLSPTCLVSRVLVTIAFIIVLGITLARFFMAIFFSWFMAKKLTKDPLFSARPVQGADTSMSVSNVQFQPSNQRRRNARADETGDIYTAILVTCYSEGRDSIRATLDSLALTDFNDDRKLLFVVADGLITGKGEKKSTPDLILGMMDVDWGVQSMPCSYVAVASGKKRHNMAKVFVGKYSMFSSYLKY